MKPISGRKRKIKKYKVKNAEDDTSDESDDEIKVAPSPPVKKQTRSTYDLWGSNGKSYCYAKCYLHCK